MERPATLLAAMLSVLCVWSPVEAEKGMGGWLSVRCANAEDTEKVTISSNAVNLQDACQLRVMVTPSHTGTFSFLFGISALTQFVMPKDADEMYMGMPKVFKLVNKTETFESSNLLADRSLMLDDIPLAGVRAALGEQCGKVYLLAALVNGSALLDGIALVAKMECPDETGVDLVPVVSPQESWSKDDDGSIIVDATSPRIPVEISVENRGSAALAARTDPEALMVWVYLKKVDGMPVQDPASPLVQLTAEYEEAKMHMPWAGDVMISSANVFGSTQPGSPSIPAGSSLRLNLVELTVPDHVCGDALVIINVDPFGKMSDTNSTNNAVALRVRSRCKDMAGGRCYVYGLPTLGRSLVALHHSHMSQPASVIELEEATGAIQQLPPHDQALRMKLMTAVGLSHKVDAEVDRQIAIGSCDFEDKMKEGASFESSILGRLSSSVGMIREPLRSIEPQSEYASEALNSALTVLETVAQLLQQPGALRTILSTVIHGDISMFYPRMPTGRPGRDQGGYGHGGYGGSGTGYNPGYSGGGYSGHYSDNYGPNSHDYSYKSGDYSYGSGGHSYGSGDYSSGDYSSGDYSSGDYSSGDYSYSSGDYGSGDYSYSSGDYGSGDYSYSSGDYGSGDYSYSSGDYGSGDYSYSSGDYGSGDYSYSSGDYSGSSGGATGDASTMQRKKRSPQMIFMDEDGPDMDMDVNFSYSHKGTYSGGYSGYSGGYHGYSGYSGGYDGDFSYGHGMGGDRGRDTSFMGPVVRLQMFFSSLSRHVAHGDYQTYQLPGCMSETFSYNFRRFLRAVHWETPVQTIPGYESVSEEFVANLRKVMRMLRMEKPPALFDDNYPEALESAMEDWGKGQELHPMQLLPEDFAARALQMVDRISRNYTFRSWESERERKNETMALLGRVARALLDQDRDQVLDKFTGAVRDLHREMAGGSSSGTPPSGKPGDAPDARDVCKRMVENTFKKQPAPMGSPLLVQRDGDIYTVSRSPLTNEFLWKQIVACQCSGDMGGMGGGMPGVPYGAMH